MLSLIVAIGKNNEIGKNNSLLWHIPEDLQFFREKTLNKIIVMGSNTFYSLPKVLPNRKHIVLTLDEYEFPKEVMIYNNFNKLLDDLTNMEEEIVIIGGEAIYKLFINYVDKMYITEIDKEYNDADRFFPKFNRDDWNKKIISTHECDGIKYSHVEYTKYKKGDVI